MTSSAAVDLTVSSQRDSSSRRFWRGFAKNRIAVAGFIILLALVTLATAGPFFTADPAQQDVLNRLQRPSANHLFGTDELGRDIFARVQMGRASPLPRASPRSSLV